MDFLPIKLTIWGINNMQKEHWEFYQIYLYSGELGNLYCFRFVDHLPFLKENWVEIRFPSQITRKISNKYRVYQR